MTDVVQERRQADHQTFFGIQLAQLGDHPARQMVGAQGVLEASMGGAGIDEKSVTELADVPQALYGRCVENRERLGLEADVVPERVANDLVGGAGDLGTGLTNRG